MELFNEKLCAAIQIGFTNGFAKEFVTLLIIAFMLPHNDLIFYNSGLISLDQDCAADGFLLEREYLSRGSSASSITIDSTAWNASHNSAPSLRSLLSPKLHKHYRKADVISRLKHRKVFTKQNIPILNGQSLREAMVQCLSYGLAYRHRKKYAYAIKLLIITPFVWCILTLPPYSEEMCGPLIFNGFRVLGLKGTEMTEETSTKFILLLYNFPACVISR